MNGTPPEVGCKDYILADGDIVEDKNLVRQNFSFTDVGENKAAVMAERYSDVFFALHSCDYGCFASVSFVSDKMSRIPEMVDTSGFRND